MYLKKAITILAIAAQLCFSLELEPIAKYEGKHSYKCIREQRLTGTLLNDKIYTFGGCYPVPYMVDPENEYHMNHYAEMERRFNTTDSVYAYDIQSNTWAMESPTPIPINGARVQVVNNDIYMFDIHGQPDYHRSLMWKYVTDTKEWQVLDKIPFMWRSLLFSCENDGTIYFTGNHDGEVRNVIQRYDTTHSTWMSPIYFDQQLILNKMFCLKDSIQLIGRKVQQQLDDELWRYNGEDDIPKQTLSFFSASYDDGQVVDNAFNISVTFGAQASVRGDWLYIYDVLPKNTALSKLNVLTKETVSLGTLDETIHATLFVPYDDDSAFLIGGGSDMWMDPRQSKNKIKSFSHKVKFGENSALHDDSLENTEDPQLVYQHVEY